MSAIQHHFTRLRELLPPATVAQLERAYQADKRRQCATKRAQQHQEADTLAAFTVGDDDTRRALRAQWPALVPRFDAIAVEELRLA